MTTSLALRMTALAAVVFAAAGCGGGAASDAGDSAGDSAGAASSASVEIADNAYSPSSVEIAGGGTVTWTNSDSVPHTVTFDGAGPASSDQLDQGATFSATFNDAGEFPYHCTVHPEMAGTVVVS